MKNEPVEEGEKSGDDEPVEGAPEQEEEPNSDDESNNSGEDEPNSNDESNNSDDESNNSGEDEPNSDDESTHSDPTDDHPRSDDGHDSDDDEPAAVTAPAKTKTGQEKGKMTIGPCDGKTAPGARCKNWILGFEGKKWFLQWHDAGKRAKREPNGKHFRVVYERRW